MYPYFPDLGDIEPTRKTLHRYAAAVGVVPRAHAIPHPKWWHLSFKVRPDGLVTDAIPLPGGGSFALRLDLLEHNAVLSTSRGWIRVFSLQDGLTGTEFGDRILQAVSALGIEGEYAREKFRSDEPRTYDADAASRLFNAFVNVEFLFRKHRASLAGEKSPVQLWPHGFDLAFEWFGPRIVAYETHGQVTEYPSQLNLGFFPGEPEPYFYSNPWPFEDDLLLSESLPAGARWFTESWKGTFLPYASLVGADDAPERLLEFARRVYEIAAPTLR